MNPAHDVNKQKWILQIDESPVENFWIRHCLPVPTFGNYVLKTGVIKWPLYVFTFIFKIQKRDFFIFTARWYVSEVLAMALCPSVCPSVCPSQVGVLLKQLNVGSHKQHHTIALDSSFLLPKISAKFDRDHPLRGHQMQVGWVTIGDFPQITGYISKTAEDRRMVSVKVE